MLTIKSKLNNDSMTDQLQISNGDNLILSWLEETGNIKELSLQLKRLFDNDLIKKTKAYQTNNIYYLDSDIWYLSGGGLESIDIMMDDISNILNNQGE